MVTIKDVAKKAGVSIATVSRALHRTGYIKDETYKRVLSAANELGYITNQIARHLKCNSVKTVGFIISDINNTYYLSILSDLKKLLKEHGFELIIAFSSENADDEIISFNSLIASRVSAIFFTPTNKSNSDIIRIAKQNHIKVIQIFRDVYDDLDTIINDDEKGCALATEQLIADGCKKLLLVDVKYRQMDYKDVSPKRSIGFLNAVNKYEGLEYKVYYYPLIDYAEKSLFNIINEYKPDGIVTATSNFSYVALSYMKEKNTSVKLISFDDNKWLKLNSITAVRQNLDILINTIMDFVCTSSDKIRKIKIPQTLIIR